MICVQHGPVYSCYHDVYDPKVASAADFQVVKTHRFTQEFLWWPSYIFTIYRDPDEVIASMNRFAASGGKRYSAYDAAKGFAHLALYNKSADFMAQYSQLMRSPASVVRSIAATMQLSVNVDEAIEAWRGIAPPGSGYDPVTLLHSNHITSNEF